MNVNPDETCEARTGIPIVRCTECGKFQAANGAATIFRPWLRRLTSLVLGAWVIITILIFIPPSLRPRLAYLWIVDGKALPQRTL